METDPLSDQQIQENQLRKKRMFAVILLVAVLWALLAVPDSYFTERHLPFGKQLLYLGLPLILMAYLKRLKGNQQPNDESKDIQNRKKMRMVGLIIGGMAGVTFGVIASVPSLANNKYLTYLPYAFGLSICLVAFAYARRTRKPNGRE